MSRTLHDHEVIGLNQLLKPVLNYFLLLPRINLGGTPTATRAKERLLLQHLLQVYTNSTTAQRQFNDSRAQQNYERSVVQMLVTCHAAVHLIAELCFANKKSRAPCTSCFIPCHQDSLLCSLYGAQEGSWHYTEPGGRNAPWRRQHLCQPAIIPSKTKVMRRAIQLLLSYRLRIFPREHLNELLTHTPRYYYYE